MKLVITELRKDYHRNIKGIAEGDRPALNGVSLTINEGDFFTLLGPSGCGKTTLLRCIAGLEQPDSGEISLGDQIFFSSAKKKSVPPNRRGLGMVFQSYAIWPHMDAAENVAYPLTVGARRGSFSKAEIEKRVSENLSLVQIGHLAKRRATKLSGGQQQRLALARALVSQPPVLLLDEPLSNLDTQLREDLRIELVRLQAQLGVTSVYVTHDQSEALVMSSSVAILREGSIEQIDAHEALYDFPRNRFIASFLGAANLLPVQITAVKESKLAHGDSGFRFETKTSWGATFAAYGRFAKQEDTQATAAIRAEGISLSSPQPGGDPNWLGTVETTHFLGDAFEYRLVVGGQLLRARCGRSNRFAVGDKVQIGLRDRACTVLVD